MREYAKLSPTFWTGETGKALRKRGTKALLVAAYLVSSPTSNMLGLYYQPVLYMAHETGLGIEGASEGLKHCIECGFCAYDQDTEFVFVFEMAKWQIADVLKATDLRCKGIQKDYEALPANPFLAAFFDRYAKAFHMAGRRTTEDQKPEVEQAPSKPHRSQEQEQEQEQEKEGAIAPLSTAAPSTSTTADLLGEVVPTVAPPCPHLRLLDLFAELVPELPQPRRELWEGGKGADAMRQRWKWLLTAKRSADGTRYATNTEEGVDWFHRFFEAVGASDFLTGRSGAWSSCDLTWLMGKENFAKVVQGNYTNKTKEAA